MYLQKGKVETVERILRGIKLVIRTNLIMSVEDLPVDGLTVVSVEVL